MIKQINNIDIKEDHELVIVGDFNLPDVSWNNGVVNSPMGTTNKCLLMHNKFMDMFKYKNLQWLMGDNYITFLEVWELCLRLTFFF